MTLKSLRIHNFRNISQVELALDSRVNLFYGLNGAGKTSVLEAIALLGRGRSFRSHKLKPLIQQGSEGVTVYGELMDAAGEMSKLGVQRNRNGQDQFRRDGKPIASAAELAKLLPQQAIFSETFELLAGGPTERRQFLDWLVFHVEPDFYRYWQQARQALKQRNTLLRSGRITPALLAPWDLQLSRAAAHIDRLRGIVFSLFRVQFDALIEEFLPLKNLSISYTRGWDADTDYGDLLLAHYQRDAQLGYTSSGPHRADLRIKIDRLPAEDVLSRGQQKLLVCALRICCGLVFRESTGQSCIFLIDDLPSELDGEHREKLISWLVALEAQVFITGVHRSDLVSNWQNKKIPYQVFHVEQGQIHRVSEE